MKENEINGLRGETRARELVVGKPLKAAKLKAYSSAKLTVLSIEAEGDARMIRKVMRQVRKNLLTSIPTK